MMRPLLLLALALHLLQGTPPDLRFEDYPVKDVFTGKPADPKIVEPWARMFRTRIREGVSKRWGVIHYEGPGPLTADEIADGVFLQPGEEKQGPNFAGHYFAIRWGCGTGCARMAIVDASNGKVLPPPLSAPGDPLV